MGRSHMALGEPPTGQTTDELTTERRGHTHTDTLLRAAGGAGLAIGITGALAINTVAVVFIAALGAVLGATLPRLLSGHVLFHSKPHRRLG
jgi:hypothetical protein